MFKKSKRFVSVCSIATLLITGIVSAGFADSDRDDDRDHGRKWRKERKERRDRDNKPAPAPTPTPAPTPAPAPAPALDGAALYTQNCAMCHGQGMRGKSASSIQSAINNNVGGMGFLKSLSPAQIDAISK